ncbi:GMC oxidoreductase [Ustulina deusta]|nr:GMC oxidoreductase [Ustulina deusta]
MRVRVTKLTVALASVAHASPVGRLLGSSFGLPGSDATYDYVIVGGGTAGLTLASRLVEQKAGSVAVVEAGSFYELGQSNISQIPADTAFYTGKSKNDTQPRTDWGYITTPQAGAFNEELHYPRPKMLGGCSGRNYMIYQRPTVGAMDKWAETVNDTSFTFANLLPWLEKSVHFTPPNAELRLANATPEYDASSFDHSSGPLSVTYPNFAYTFPTWGVEAFKEMGISPRPGFVDGALFGHAYSLFTIDAETQTRASSETAFLQRSLHDSNYFLYDLTMGKQIIFDAVKKATGVRVNTLGADYTLSARKEVILSAGVIGSPQLLQASGVGPREVLEPLGVPVVSDLAGVGQGFQDHILFGVTHKIAGTTASSLANADFSAEQNRLFLEDAAGALTNPAVDVLAFEKLPNATRASLSENTRRVLARDYPEDWPEVEYITLSAYLGDFVFPLTADPGDGADYAALSVVLCAPRSRGSVNITSPDTAVHPALDPGFLTDAADIEVAVAGLKRARAFWATRALRGYADPTEAYPGAHVSSDGEIADSIRRSFQTIFHGASTCAMGVDDDPRAVVDTVGRVRGGVSGLRVVDASIFPFLPPGHPQSTIYALAEKIACDISGNC